MKQKTVSVLDCSFLLKTFYFFIRFIYSLPKNIALLTFAFLTLGIPKTFSQTTTYYLNDTTGNSSAATIWDLSTTPGSNPDYTTDIKVSLGSTGVYQFIPGKNTTSTFTASNNFTGGG